MKILHCVNRFDYCDGCARHVFILAKTQKRRGDKVCVITGTGNALDLLETESIPYKVIPTMLHEERTISRFFLGSYEVWKAIRVFDPSIIHTHHYYVSNQIFWNPFFRKKAKVLTVHANLNEHGILPPYLGDRIVAVSESTREHIVSHYPNIHHKIKVILSGSEFLDEFSNDSQVNSGKTEKPGESKIFRVLYAGRLVRSKGVHVLIQAVAEMKETIPISLMIVGDGEEEDYLKDLSIKYGVASTFEKTVRYIRSVMDLADVVVVPSIGFEGLPLVLIESGLLKKTVLASDVDGLGEIIEHEKTGLLVQPGSVKELAIALKRLYDDRRLARELGVNLFHKVHSEFNVELMTDRISDLYDKIGSK